MEGDVVLSLKWTSNISKNHDQNIQIIFKHISTKFYEDIFG
jgi:hypothetical protein